MSRLFVNLGGLTRFFTLVVILSALFLTPTLQAQLFRGSISGTVTDAQNAAVSGVKVTIKNKDTGVVQTTSTTSAGIYSVPLDAGTYTVEFSKSSFQTQQAEGVVVTSAKDTTLNAALKVGGV